MGPQDDATEREGQAECGSRAEVCGSSYMIPFCDINENLFENQLTQRV